ncbi:unnamed protein product, partial [Timema podura]|nr:unnamed protein product [Timema podura]
MTCFMAFWSSIDRFYCFILVDFATSNLNDDDDDDDDDDDHFFTFEYFSTTALVNLIIKLNPYFSSKYVETFQRSIENPEEFWAEVGRGVSWSKTWDRVLDDTNQPFTKWFVGGELNACYNAVDRHVEAGRGGKVALIHDSPITKTVRHVTYLELQDKVSRLAGALADLGVGRGDRVLIYMPLIPEAIIAMLATARLGAIHSVVFGGFAARELCARIEHAEPKIIIAASCGVEPNKVVR